eukprot:16229049-Heterocapsa_arctica.AAC.1
MATTRVLLNVASKTRPNAFGGTTRTKPRFPRPSKGKPRMARTGRRPRKAASAEEGTRRVSPPPWELSLSLRGPE